MDSLLIIAAREYLNHLRNKYGTVKIEIEMAKYWGPQAWVRLEKSGDIFIMTPDCPSGRYSTDSETVQVAAKLFSYDKEYESFSWQWKVPTFAVSYKKPTNLPSLPTLPQEAIDAGYELKHFWINEGVTQLSIIRQNNRTPLRAGDILVWQNGTMIINNRRV
jgi:hypothetical protein